MITSKVIVSIFIALNLSKYTFVESYLARNGVMACPGRSRSLILEESGTEPSASTSRKKSILGRSLKKISTLKGKNGVRLERKLKDMGETSPEEQAKLEWEQLDKAAAEAGDAFEDALRAKLDGWKRLKEEGVLDKIDESFTEDDLAMIDELSAQLLNRRVSTKSKRQQSKENSKFTIHGIDPSQLASEFSSLSGGGSLTDDEKVYIEYSEKLKKVGGQKKGTAKGVKNLINELNDKGLLKGQGELIEDCLMALSRLDSAPAAAAAYGQYLEWVRSGIFSIDDFDTHTYPHFAVTFANSCFSNGLVSAGHEARDDVLTRAGDIDVEMAKIAFLPGLVCAAIHEHASPPNYQGDTYKEAAAPAEVLSQLSTLHAALPQLTADQVNIVIRMLGKKRLVREIFILLDKMRDAADGGRADEGVLESGRGSGRHRDRVGVTDIESFSLYSPTSPIRPNDESLEFLANALVASVEEQSSSRSMKDLPSPLLTSPEVLLVGRSNVGKSSLVNFLVNRKAMASVSATPGHTTQFHFFAVNAGRSDLPSFRLVDVPGLGYAEAEDNTVVSWKSLLQRYLAVRDSLGVVLHLIDSRHKLTPIDKTLIEMAIKASRERDQGGTAPAFRYCVVLTKCDRAPEKDLRSTLRDVKESVAPLEDSLREDVPIVVSSAIERRGRDDIWKVLQSFVVK